MAIKQSAAEYRRLSRVFGARLRDIRKARDMSQEEFGRLLGVSKQVLSRYECGQQCPSLVLAWGFSHKLGIPLSAMVGDMPPDVRV